MLLLPSLASREYGSFPLASKTNNCKWQFARCVQTYETQIFLNLLVHCTNFLDLKEVHPCNGYSSTNLDRIRLQNSRVFFLKRSLRISHARRAPDSHGLSPVSLSLLSLAPDLLFDCLRVVEYAKIRTVCSLLSYGNLEMLVSAERVDRSTRRKTFLNKERTNIKLNPLIASLLGPSNISARRVVSFLPSTCSLRGKRPRFCKRQRSKPICESKVSRVNLSF